MAYPGKMEQVLELFLNEPTKHWHFKDIVKQAHISEARASFWLSQLKAQNIIQHVKPKGKLPYFIGNYEHLDYQNRKRLYAIDKMTHTGLFSRLQSLPEAKAIIIFGSFVRGDWNTQSDVDVFVYGDPGKLRSGTLWQGREVQVHSCKTKGDIKEIRSGLMDNVVKGLFIKGNIHDLAEVRT